MADQEQPPRTGMCEAARGVLVVIDVQERLAAAMPPEDRARLLRNLALLTQAAALLGVPVVRTEQYPKGLGPTEAEVLRHLPAGNAPIEKTCFSCADAPAFREAVAGCGRAQAVLTGMESHFCVLQSALDLQAGGQQVFVVEDAVCARQRANHENAMQRLQNAGVVVTNAESVIFEWLRDAAHPQFKAVSRLLK